MPIFTAGGQPLDEAKRVKGKEYKILSKNVDSDGNMAGSPSENNMRGTTSLGSGILDSKAQRNKESFDLFSEDSDLFSDFFLEFETPDGPENDEDEDTIDDNVEEEETDTPETTNNQDNAEDATTDNQDQEAETPEEDNNTDDENFDLDDQEGEQETQDNTEQPEEQNEQPEPEDNEDEDFELPDENEGGNEEPETTGTDTAGEEDTGLDGGEGNTDEEDSGTSDTSEDSDSKLKELERVAFEELSDAEKKAKVKELKSLFINIHDKCKPIIDKVNEIQKDESTIQIVEYVSNSLLDLQKYITDYLSNIFDSKTYVENLAQCQKYIAVLNAINTIFEELSKENNN